MSMRESQESGGAGELGGGANVIRIDKGVALVRMMSQSGRYKNGTARRS
jgi:hypothetical protein